MIRTKWLSSLILCFFVFSTNTLLSQTKWILKGGGYYDTWTVDKWDESMKRPAWMVELGIETPLSKYEDTWMFETGIRYINRYVQIWEDEEMCDMIIDDKCHNVAIPLKIGYNLPIGNSQLRLSVGPNASYLINSDVHSDEYNRNGFRVGIEPSLTINYKALQVGVSYDIPVYKGYVNENKNNLMVTLGVRFSSKAWAGIGAGLLAVGAVAGGIAAAYSGIDVSDTYGSSYNQSTTDNGYTQSPTYTQSSTRNGDSSSRSLKKTDRDKERKQREAELKEDRKRTNYITFETSSVNLAYQTGYDTLIKMHSSPEKYLSNMSYNQFRKEVKDTQDRLKEILKNYKKNSGRDLPVDTKLLNWIPEKD